MTQLLFIDFFYTTWGKVLTYLLLLVVPFFTLIGIERMDRRRPLGVYLLLALWLFVSTFERNLFDCNWLGWIWLFATLGIGIGSAYTIGPSFYEVKWVDEPLNFILTSALNSLLITSICIVSSDSFCLPIYITLALICHFISCENYIMALTPLFSILSIGIVWLSMDFNCWYIYLLFAIGIFLQVVLAFASAASWTLSREKDDNLLGIITSTVISVITFACTIYIINSQCPILEFIGYNPYWSIIYILLFIATIIRSGGGFATLATLTTIVYSVIFWTNLCIPFENLSLPNWSLSLPSVSSWNWDLFSFTWCSVIMWVGIAIGSLISVFLLVGLFVENGLYALKYICHTFISVMFIYELAFNKVPIDASWGYWTLFAIGIIFILADYCLIYAMTRGNCDNVTIGFHFTISLVLVSCLCYILYTESESVYLLIASVISGLICSSVGKIVHRTVSKVSAPVRVKVKPAMQYSGTSMTCPACREQYKTTWVTGIQEKNIKRDVARTATNAAVGGVSIGGFTSLGATIGSAVPGPGTVIGAGIGFLVGSIASVAVKNKINENVDEIYDYTSSEYGDGLKYRFRCPEPGCGHVWYKTIRHGVIVR